MNRYLLTLPCLLLAGCAGLTAAETTSVVAAGTTATAAWLTDMFGIVQPFLKPEQVAALSGKLAAAQNWSEALVQAVGAVGQGLSDVRAAAEAAQQRASEGVTAGEVAAYSGGAAAAGAAVSRAMSVVKHGFAGKTTSKPA